MKNKIMKIGMLGIVSNLGTRLYSHNAGWTHVTRSILSEYFNVDVDILSNTDTIDEYDILIINEGVNFKPGVFNFFGGAQDRQKDALIRFSNYTNKVFYLNDEVDYAAVCKKRKDLKDLSNLNFPDGEVLDITNLSDSIIIGDSHSISAWEPGRTIKRLDGKTLNGALNIGLKNLIPKNTGKDVQFYFGNIDVRFHFKRFGGTKCIDDLIERYVEQLLLLKREGYNIKLTHLIPIEDESRKIPGSGKYKGKNFFGTQKERSEYVYYFNTEIDSIAAIYGFKVATWDNLNFEKLSFDDMESRQSVHIRPSSYMHSDKIKM